MITRGGYANDNIQKSTQMITREGTLMITLMISRE